MSGVYVPGMEMPKNCNECAFTVLGYCRAWNSFPNGEALNRHERADFCPLVPVPAHGRLIDADAAAKQGWTISRTYSASPTEMVYEVKTMTDEVLPTIIPADKDGGT